MLNDFRKIGKYEISNLCLQSFPCKHYIKLENGNVTLKSSDQIYRLFKSEGLTDPHIDKYAEWVRKCDFPTPEEILEDKNNFLKNQKESEIRTKERDEKQKIIEQYKASSQIDKLKKKHNIYN